MVTSTRSLGWWERVRLAASVVRGLTIDQWFQAHEAGGDASGKDRPRHPYDEVAAVYGCVQMRANAMAMMPLRVSTLNEEVVEDGPIVRLLSQPNEHQTRRDFIKCLSATLDLSGKVHLVFLDGTAGGVIVAHPKQMRPVRNPAGELMGWKFRPAGTRLAQAVPLATDQVHTIREPDFDAPTDPDACVSPLAAVRLAVSQYYKADLANESSLDHNVEPGGVFTMDGQPTEPQLEDVKNQLRAREGSRNRRRALVLYGGMKWESIAAAFSEMEFAELKRMSRQDICAGFGLHQLLVFPSDEGLSSGAMDDAEEVAWTTTHLARAEWIAEQLTLAVISRFQGDVRRSVVGATKRAMTRTQRHAAVRGDARQRAQAFDLPYYAWFDATRVPAVIRRIAKQTESMERLTRIGVPLNHAADLMGVPVEDQPWGNTWWRPAGLVDVRDDAPLPEGDGSPPNQDASDALEELETLEATESSADATRERAAGRAFTEGQLAEVWRSWRDSFRGLERAFDGPYRRDLLRRRGEALAQLRETLPAVTDPTDDVRAVPYHWLDVSGDGVVPREAVYRLGVQQRDLIAQVLFDVQATTDGLSAVIGPVLREAVTLGGAQSVDEAAAAQGLEPDTIDPFNVADPGVDDALRRRRVRIADLTLDQADRLRATLAEGLAAGEGAAALEDRVRHQFNVELGRSKTVAYQEVGTAVEEARQLGREQAGVPAKSWLWSRKETGRPRHAATERATLSTPIPVDEDFVIAGTSTRCPHPRGSGVAEEDIRCACTTLSRYPGDRVAELRLCAYLTTRGVLSVEILRLRAASPLPSPDSKD
ncbi:MAG: phage portal protein [Planctomycetota bacterium]